MNLKKTAFWGALSLALLKILTAPVYAQDKDKDPFEAPEKDPFTKESTEDNFDIYFGGKGILSTNDYHYGNFYSRALLKFNKSRIGLDLHTNFGKNQDLDSVVSGLGAYFGQYFTVDELATNFYAQLGVGVNISKLNQNGITLDETVWTPKLKVGAFNDEFIADITVALDLGKYSLEGEGYKQSGDETGIGIKGNFRKFLSGSWDVEAGFNFASKTLDDLWNYFVSEVGVGVVYEKEPIAIQFAPYWRHTHTESGLNKTQDEFGVQAIGYIRESENLMLYVGLCLDTEHGGQVMIGLRLKD